MVIVITKENFVGPTGRSIIQGWIVDYFLGSAPLFGRVNGLLSLFGSASFAFWPFFGLCLGLTSGFTILIIFNKSFWGLLISGTAPGVGASICRLLCILVGVEAWLLSYVKLGFFFWVFLAHLESVREKGGEALNSEYQILFALGILGIPPPFLFPVFSKNFYYCVFLELYFGGKQ